MPQHQRLVNNTHPFQLIPLAEDIPDTFNHVIDLTLGIHSSGNGQAHHFQRCGCEFAGRRIGFAEHHAADFTGTNATT